jgi:hypothetical protein
VKLALDDFFVSETLISQKPNEYRVTESGTHFFIYIVEKKLIEPEKVIEQPREIQAPPPVESSSGVGTLLSIMGVNSWIRVAL